MYSGDEMYSLLTSPYEETGYSVRQAASLIKYIHISSTSLILSPTGRYFGRSLIFTFV